MKLILKRVRLMELLLGTDVRRPPVFKVRHELFRLVHGARSSRAVPNNPDHVELTLERTLEMEPAATITLRASDVEGDDSKLWVRGREVVMR